MANTCNEPNKNTSKQPIKSDVCSWWLRGKCLYGETCKLKHPKSLFATQTSQQMRKEYLRQNNERNKQITDGSKKHWGKKKRTKKESIFRHWLLDNFGRDLLGKSSKYGILDIAGGKGVLSFEFVNLNGIKSTVCDPRQHLNLKRCTKALKGGYSHKNKLIVERYIDCTLQQCLNRSDEQITPQHLRLFFDEKLINILDDYYDYDNIDNDKLDALIAYQLKQFKKFNKDIKLLEMEIDHDGLIILKKQIKNDCLKMMDLMKNCCVIIGMHPDYATEFLIDFALKYKKPFAVLPCCVFPKSFPNRRLNGKRVMKYDDFCDYLMGKHEEISQCTLTLMNGQNKVIYWIPTSNNDSLERQTLCQLI